ncbi:hypothetical protein [Azospirillum sp.]|uniref:hypothetical protein n=1 Tax=Azospirillum sp. TaxID=34012 RepID=UPI0026027D4D|nr:hypothetical protein [Azospirillum sp.]
MAAPPVFDPSGFFDGADLDRLMMADAQTGAEGVYRHSHWSVSFAEGTVEPLRLLANMHEGMHATLNDCTGYGSLLHVYAHLLRNDVEPTNTRRLLGGLVQKTRTAHEAFATFASVVAVGEGSESPTLLQGYPLYCGYLQQAQALLVGLTGASSAWRRPMPCSGFFCSRRRSSGWPTSGWRRFRSTSLTPPTGPISALPLPRKSPPPRSGSR